MARSIWLEPEDESRQAISTIISQIAQALGSAVFDRLWSVEPLSYIGAVVLLLGLGITSLSFFVPIVIAKYRGVDAYGDSIAERWAQITQQ